MADGKNDGRLVFDCLSAILLLLVAVLGAYMPKYLARKGSLQQGTASSLAFHLGNMLSGGVMLSAGFCHLLADALRQLAFIGRFPIAPFLAAVGYLITLLADQVVQLLTTDAEGQASQAPSPQPTPGAGQGLGQHSIGPRASPEPSASPGFGFLRGGLAGSKAWGYSRLEDQQQPAQDGWCQGSGIELISSNSIHINGDTAAPAAATATATAAASASETAGTGATPGTAHCSSGSCPDGSLMRQAAAMPCCHNPASCPCCIARSIGDGEGSRADSASLNPSTHQQPGGAHAPTGYSRRPGSAGGLPRAGLGLGSVARTRSLTSPVAVPALSPLQAAAAAELALPCRQGAADAAVTAGAGGAAAAAAAVVGASAAAGAAVPQPQPVSIGGSSVCDTDDTQCLLAAGSPRSVSAGGLHPRSPKIRPAAALTHHCYHQQQQQQQQQQHPLPGSIPEQQGQQLSCNGHYHHHQQQQQQHQPGVLGLQQLQLQQQPPQELQRANSSSIGQLLLQPVRQLSVPGCVCCCGGSAWRSGLPSAQPDMTEACTVARVAGHLELEVMSTTTGGHNHGHFQVFLSHRPLSFATSLLLACALCIHSILEGLALGAQQSMQATEDIMLAIAAHKGLAAYALGASIVESGASDSKFWVVVCLFAAATPLGIAIGYASSVLGHGPVSAAMSALASGTFLYVALNEVIPKELEHPDGHRLAKVAALLLGFGLMSLLAVWA